MYITNFSHIIANDAMERLQGYVNALEKNNYRISGVDCPVKCVYITLDSCVYAVLDSSAYVNPFYIFMGYNDEVCIIPEYIDKTKNALDFMPLTKSAYEMCNNQVGDYDSFGFKYADLIVAYHEFDSIRDKDPNKEPTDKFDPNKVLDLDGFNPY